MSKQTFMEFGKERWPAGLIGAFAGGGLVHVVMKLAGIHDNNTTASAIVEYVAAVGGSYSLMSPLWNKCNQGLEYLARKTVERNERYYPKHKREDKENS